LATLSNPTFTLRELQVATGIPARTLLRWIRSKLLPRALGRGRASRYGDEHLLRAKVIRQLRSQRQALHVIRERLVSSSKEQLAASLSASQVAQSPIAPAPPTLQPSYPFTTWEVVQLRPGLALLVHPARGAEVRELADQLYRHCVALPVASG
jgi:DNA-binding transcriptional MerR regulator